MRWHLALAAALIGVWSITAHAASTIVPNLLPVGIPANAGLINQNFGNAINDVNALQTQNAGVTAPSNPSAGNLWLSIPQNSTTFTLNEWDGKVWVPIGSFDSVNHIWMPPIGGGVPPTILSATTTDLGSVPQATVSISGVNAIQSFGASAPAGTIKVVLFTAATPLINSASLILPQGVNITQTAGSNISALALGAGTWRVLFDSDIVAPTFNITGGAVASNNAALEALPSTATTFVTRLGFAAAGDAPPLGFIPSGSACILNAGAGDGGSQVASADGKCWLARFSGSMDIREWGADPTDTNDSTGPVTAALAYCGTVGGTVTPGNGAYKVLSANITVPTGCTWDSGIWIGNQVGTGGSAIFATKPAIWLNPAFTIQLANNAGFYNTAVFQNGLSVPTSLRTAYQGIASFAGTALTAVGNNPHVSDVYVIGFNQAFTQSASLATSAWARPYIDHFFYDSTNGISLTSVQDVGTISTIEGFPFYTANQAWSAVTSSISAIANNGSGAIRITVPSTATFQTGDVDEVGNIVSGSTGARGRWPVTVVDATHLDLQGSQFAPAPVCTWGGVFVLGSQAMTCNSVSGLWVGMVIPATAGIPTNDSILAIDQHSDTVYLTSPATAGGSAVTVNFAQGGSYSGDGIIYQNTIYRTGKGLEILNSAEVKFNDVFLYGYDTSYHFGGSAVNAWAHCVSCSDDHYTPPGDPTSVSLLIDGEAGVSSWIGGQLNGAGTAVVMNTTNGNAQTISDAWISTNSGLHMAMSLQQGRLTLVGDTMYNSQISILDTISNVTLGSDDFFGSSILFNTATGFAQVRTNIDSATILAAGQGAVYQKACVDPSGLQLQLQFGGSSTGITYAANNNACYYRNVGGFVIVTFNMLLTSKGSATGAATLANLPLESQIISVGTGALYGNNMNSLTGQVLAQVNPGSTTVYLFESGTTGETTLTNSSFNNNSEIAGTITYPIQ
jgi:hypothetical protein